MELGERKNIYSESPCQPCQKDNPLYGSVELESNEIRTDIQTDGNKKKSLSASCIFLIIFCILLIACIISLFVQTFELQKQKMELLEIINNQNRTLDEKIGSQTMDLDFIKQKVDRSCPGVTFHFPRGDQVNDSVKYLSPFPRLEDATVCAWIDKNNVSIDGENEEHATFITILSYFISKDELIIGITSKRNLYLRIKSTPVNISANLPSENQTFHLCVKMMSSENQVKVYVNGTLQAAVNYTYDVVPGGGSFVLAQEQDGESFIFKDAFQAFRGSITNLMIWPRSLSDQEINNIATKCDCPQDYSVAMTMDRSELNGNASYTVPDQCPTL